MTSRYDHLQDPKDRRHVVLFRSAASVTIVTALMFVAAVAPRGEAGDTVAVELLPAAPQVSVSSIDAPSAPAATPVATPPGDYEYSNFDEMHPTAYMGQSGVQG